MKSRQIFWMGLSSIALILTSCGRTQEVTGNWVTPCTASTITKLSLQGDKAEIETSTFAEAACENKTVTTKASGKFDVVNSHKEGVRNSITLVLDPQVKIALSDADEVKAANNVLLAMRDDKDEKITPNHSDPDRARIRLNNRQIASGRLVADFKAEQENTFTADQLERASGKGLIAAQVFTKLLPFRPVGGGDRAAHYFRERLKTQFTRDADTLILENGLIFHPQK